MTTAHLDDAQVAAALSGRGPQGRHLEECAACRAELQGLRSAVEALREEANAPWPEAFWRAQREELERRRRRLAGAAAPGWPAPLLWLGAAAAVALALWSGLRAPAAPPGPDPDDELLVAVERSLRRDVPAALEAGLVLTGELALASGDPRPAVVTRRTR